MSASRVSVVPCEQVPKAEVVALLEEFENPDITPEMWSTLIDYPWKTEEDTAGLVLLGDGARQDVIRRRATWTPYAEPGAVATADVTRT